ncbi:MAG: DUF1013 domain-containing protein [Alphaproteobacteria bacterium]|nr:DUF1013 domain-containing protein [Alphaproteobacteria bacterium]
MNAPIMPKATAKWLVFNTTLTFDQIAAFTQLHPLEVQSIADDETAQHMKAVDPVLMGQLTREEIVRCERDPAQQLKLLSNPLVAALQKPRKGARYTPVSKRLEKPDAIFWLLRNHPELPDAVIGRLVGTTKATIDKVRNRTHWNAANLKASDPVTLGLCTQIELDQAIEKANREKARAASGTKGSRNVLRSAKETLSEPDDDVFADKEATAEDEDAEEIETEAEGDEAEADGAGHNEDDEA